jgi:hypothetical protein
MRIVSVVIDDKALGALDRALIEDSWLTRFELPLNADGLRRVEVGDIVYLLSEEADTGSGYLVVDCEIFGKNAGLGKPRLAFERMIRVAMRQFNRGIAIPVLWQPYHVGSLVSVYAQAPRDSMQRIYIDQAPCGSSNVFAYGVSEKPENLESVPENVALYKRAVDTIYEALLKEVPPPPQVGSFGVLLSQPLEFRLSKAGSLSEWYEHRLNKEQRRFVDQSNDRPVRLRGAAGTGKTQSMVVKCLRDLYLDPEGRKSFAFLTHSSALAHEVVRGMLHALDPSEAWANQFTVEGRPRLWIGTLYELAQEKLGYEKKGLKPLSLDGSEGREYQRMLIQDAIAKVLTEPRLALSALSECSDLRDRLAQSSDDPRIIDEIMNEFACVLELENIKKDAPEAERYARASRESWQMELPSEAHRRIILEVYHVYRDLLRSAKMLSMDQMVADFARYLETHEWEQLREREGFDLVFVDEYHYFTRAESMTLHNLFKPITQVSGRWPLIMAYDLKQSTSDAAIAAGGEKFRNPGVGESVLAELKQVYRSTPQISALLRDLDASFPAMDLEGEFLTYEGTSTVEDGEIPTLSVYSSDVEMVDAIFSRAGKIAREVDGGGSQVAVLCLNESLFGKIRVAGRVVDKFVAITTREDLKELRYAKSKCVFSMPEYVAGLQFDSVFLIHADASDFDESLSNGARRRYVSRVYLGASRAAKRVVFACSKEHGGRSALLETSISNGTLSLN